MEYFFECPYCWEEISMILESDEGGGKTEYIEDCEVCCRPIEISFKIEDSYIYDFLAIKL